MFLYVCQNSTFQPNDRCVPPTSHLKKAPTFGQRAAMILSLRCPSKTHFSINPTLRKTLLAHRLSPHGRNCSDYSDPSRMESMQMMRLFSVTIIMMMAVSAVSAADPPTPAPMSAATTIYIPTAVASLSALFFAFLF